MTSLEELSMAYLFSFKPLIIKYLLMKVYRLTPKKYATDLSGMGAKLYGGRWNRVGISILYTSENLSLSVLENIVHINNPTLLPTFRAITIEIPDSFKEYSTDDFSDNWREQEGFENLRKLTDNFVEKREFLAMKVPSAIIEMEYNFLINPQHPLFKDISIIKQQDFSFDQRLFSR
jgi:RES domain-containing protein